MPEWQAGCGKREYRSDAFLVTDARGSAIKPWDGLIFAVFAASSPRPEMIGRDKQRFRPSVGNEIVRVGPTDSGGMNDSFPRAP